MAILSQIRNRIGLVFVFIVVALVAFLVSDALSSNTSSLFGNDTSVGEIAGQDIPVNYYNARFQENLENQGPLDDQRRYVVLNQTWEQIVNEVVYDNELSSIGLGVPESEVTDLLVGQNPHPTVRQFQVFWDSTGQYNPQMVQTIMQISQNPEHPAQQDAAKIVSDVIDYLYNVRREEKYMNMLKSGLLVSGNEARVANEEDTRSYNVSFFGVNYSAMQDSSELTDADYRAYYNDHKEDFKQDLAVNVNYVRFPKLPSTEDSLKAYNSAKDLIPRFMEAESDSDFVFLHSDRPGYNPSLLTITQMPMEIQQQFDGVEGDTVLGPMILDGAYQLVKLANFTDTSATSVKIRHIVFNGLTEEQKEAAKSKAQEVKGLVNAENFATMADARSDDKSFPGGAMGWIGEETLGKDFFETVSAASPGSIVLAESNQGWHVVLVENKSSEAFTVALVTKEMFVGSQTMRETYARASQFASKALTMGSIEKAATETEGVDMRTTMQPITPENTDILQLAGGRNVAAWALRSQPGELAPDIFELENDYVIAQVVDRFEEGYRPLNDVKEDIEPMVRNEVKARKIIEKLKGIQASDLNGYKTAYGAGGFVSNAAGLTIGGATAPAPLTNESELIGRIASLPLNTLSAPMKGESGVYIFQVTSVTEPTPLDNEAALANKIMVMQAGRQSRMENQFRQALRELADVKDERYKFDF